MKRMQKSGGHGVGNVREREGGVQTKRWKKVLQIEFGWTCSAKGLSANV